jgi:hypothetical protein
MGQFLDFLVCLVFLEVVKDFYGCIPNLQKHSSSKPVTLISALPQEVHVQNRDAPDFYRPALAHSADHNFIDNLPVNLTAGKF